MYSRADPLSPDEVISLSVVHKLHGAVMTQTELFSKHTYRGIVSPEAREWRAGVDIAEARSREPLPPGH